jgi:NADPH:quinone reductase
MNMKAAVLGTHGLVIQDQPMPVPGPEEILVKVRAGALNRADLGILAGHKHGSTGGPGTVLGMEWSGEVSALGERVSGFKIGDHVMCSGKGAFAEYAVADLGRVMRLPDADMSFEQAACLPVALQTMHDAVVTNGALQPGQSVLIQGASSGVGLMAMRIAKLMGASLVIGTSTDAGRRARLHEYGADLALDSSDPAWVAAVMTATNGRGVDLIVDQVSGALANQNLAATTIKGRIVNVGRLGGMRGDFDFDLHALRRIQYIGVTFRTRTTDEVRQINAVMKRDLSGHLSRGSLQLPIDRTFSFEDLAAAYAHMRSNAHFGKIVVTMT